jgi:hypothetical protein
MRQPHHILYSHYSLHAVEHNHQVKWEQVTILAKETNIRKRKIHKAAVMHIEDNIISQPSIDILHTPSLVLYTMDEKKNKRNPREETKKP